MYKLKCIHVLWDSEENVLIAFGSKVAWDNAGNAKRAFSRRNPVNYNNQSRVKVVPITLPETIAVLVPVGTMACSMEFFSRS